MAKPDPAFWDTQEMREAVVAAWNSIRAFEREFGWTEDHERALADLVASERERDDGSV